MRDIIVLGGGGHAKAVIGLLKRGGQWRILGYTDPVSRGGILGSGYLGDDSALESLAAMYQDLSAVVGVGHVESSQTRRRLAQYAQDLGFEFPSIVSIHAVVGEETLLGEGTVAMDGALVNAGTLVGRHCILNSHSVVEHDCVVGDFVHIGPGAVLSGGATVESDVLIGAGSCVIQDVRICSGVVIGAGSAVVADITEPGIYAGNPAKRIG
ncbi:MAG: acetyltransferase [Desulfomonilia bacterium]|jgi:sugar O-acyltransferase (sialic acid O-acetyltransferase NeuD family)